MAIILPIFLHGDIIKMIHYIKKNTAVRDAVKVSEIAHDRLIGYIDEFQIYKQA
jgi:hypothetical protein